MQTAESLKPSCISDSKVVNQEKNELEEYYPQIGRYYNKCIVTRLRDINVC